VRTETLIDVPFVEPQVQSLAKVAAAEYRERARYPRWTQPITDAVDPIVRDREVTRGTSLGPEGRNPTLVVYPSRSTYEAPQPVVIHAYLVQDERKVDARAIAGQVRTQQAGVLAALAFNDEGRDGDAEANDLVWTAVVAPGPERARDFKGAQLVAVDAETLGGEQRNATSGFLYSVPLAHLTGRYRDALVDGNLVLEAEVAVEAAARFHLEGTLADAAGDPLAWAQVAAVLEPGRAWMPLTYFGLVLRERGVDGPYLLRTAALSTTGEMPNQKNDVAERPHVTRAYAATDFSDQPESAPFGNLEAGGR
jgi:hypothetical protein